MCGIIGYIGRRDVSPILLEGLAKLEYRGYDSAGLCVFDGEAGDQPLRFGREVGRLANLEESLRGAPLRGSLGIGHTRWATHGEPSRANCHPHTGPEQRVAVVHNGIIENYQELKAQLRKEGHSISSDTDTEVLPHLMHRAYAEHGDGLRAVREALQQARGAYAVGAVFADEPDTLYCARHGSPLIIGLGDDGLFIASDVPAVLNEVKEVVYLAEGQVAALRRGGDERLAIQTLDGASVAPEIQPITLTAESADKGGFETYMLKEIHEQPRVLRTLLDQHVNGGPVPDIDLGPVVATDLSRVLVVSCGTAYYAGMYGAIALEHLTSLPVETEVGSEFRYRRRKILPGTLVIAVSQSGETADTLASVRLARAQGAQVLSICNVEGSTLVRESDVTLYTRAGPEIGVASTKAFTAQLMAFALLALKLGAERGEIDEDEQHALVKDLKDVPDDIHYVLARKESIRPIADKHHSGPSALYLGRRFNHPIALEGALKNKEISYQHAEGYAAGEMKHGPIALINEYMPVICVCTRTEDEVYEKMISNMREVEARHGRVIAIATEGDKAIREVAEDIIYVTGNREAFSPMINVVALQLLAYYAAQARGTDIDKPRNLAKSVTVE